MSKNLFRFSVALNFALILTLAIVIFQSSKSSTAQIEQKDEHEDEHEDEDEDDEDSSDDFYDVKDDYESDENYKMILK
jgi:hypothetical protein